MKKIFVFACSLFLVVLLSNGQASSHLYKKWALDVEMLFETNAELKQAMAMLPDAQKEMMKAQINATMGSAFFQFNRDGTMMGMMGKQGTTAEGGKWEISNGGKTMKFTKDGEDEEKVVEIVEINANRLAMKMIDGEKEEILYFKPAEQ